MFGSILGKKKKNVSENDAKHAAIVSKIANMNITDMRAYVRNAMKNFDICEDGLVAIMHRLIDKNESTQKFYLNSDDMDTKKKKAFDLVILVATSTKTTVVSLELVQKFIEIYQDIITSFDKENKQIYSSRFNDAIEVSIKTLSELTEMKRKGDILGEK